MSAPRPLSACVLICTYQRAALLAETLDSLRLEQSRRAWSVLVVDNNSTDDTRQVVERAAASFPVTLRYVFDSRQGKSHALNTGVERCDADVVLFTDDDVRVSPGWVDAACRSLDDDERLDYTGGPVRPLWGGTPPEWLDRTRGDLWGTLAILDYGNEPFVFEDSRRVPLGANMAVRRRLIEQIGGFHPELGRRGRSLLGQEQAEFFARARAFGARGRYVPEMEVQHHVPAHRLTRSYFRSWWYWKGVSRARVDAMHQRTELGLDLTEVPYVARVPRFMWGLLVRDSAQTLQAALRRDTQEAVRREMRCAYALGYVRACWSPVTSTAAPPIVRPRHEPASLSR